MSNYYSNYQYGCHHQHHKPSSVVSGNSIDIKICDCETAEVRADVKVESGGPDNECKIVRLWGQIKDCCNKPVPNALLKLVKVVCSANGTEYQGIAHTVSDCEGFYQFDLCYCDGNECYKVLVSKAYTGREQIIETGNGNCNVCVPEGGAGGGGAYQPCKPYNPVVTPGGPANQCNCAPVPPCPPYPCSPKPPCGGYQHQGGINIPSPCGC